MIGFFLEATLDKISGLLRSIEAILKIGTLILSKKSTQFTSKGVEKKIIFFFFTIFL